MQVQYYKVFSLLDASKVYIGSTKYPLKKRLAEHCFACRIGNKSKFYNFMRELGHLTFTIELLSISVVESNNERWLLEQSYIDRHKQLDYGILNTNNVIGSKENRRLSYKKWYDQHSISKIKKVKAYQLNKKNQILNQPK